jgi:hypothetical protein
MYVFMKYLGKIDFRGSLPVILFLVGFNCLSCKRNIPNQGSPEKTVTNQLGKIDEPVCGPSRGAIIKGNVHIRVDVFPKYPGGYSKFMSLLKLTLNTPQKHTVRSVALL